MARKSQVSANTEFETAQTKTKVNHHLKIRIDDLKTFEPLTENQKKFFDAYKRGDYFVGLFGSPGVGKCQGEDVEVNIMVSDELFERLNKSI